MQYNMKFKVRKADTSTLQEEKELLTKMLGHFIDHWDIDVNEFSNNQVFIQHIANEILGSSILTDAFENDLITEIHCLDWDNIWVVMNGEVKVRYPKVFNSRDHYEKIIDQLSEYGNAHRSPAGGAAEFHYFKHRVAISEYSDTLTMTIRKYSDPIATLPDLVDRETIDEPVADLLNLMIKANLNLVLGGISGSGKTTSMNAMLNSSLPKDTTRFHLIEGSKEMNIVHPCTNNREFSRHQNVANVFDTIYGTMPNRLVIDEAHSQDMGTIVQGMLTGHPTQLIMHGNNAKNTLERLLSGYIAYVESPNNHHPQAVKDIHLVTDFIIIQEIYGDGKRIITSINEVEYCEDTESLTLKPVMEYSPKTKEFIFVNTLSPKTINKMIRNGISYEDIIPFV